MGFFNTSKKGFTLVELLVALSILAIIMAVVLANMSDAKKKARDTQRMSDMQQLAIAFRVYKDFNSAYPVYDNGEVIGDASGVDPLLTPYIAGTIKDPLNSGSNMYYYDSSYSCNGVNRAVILARTMERTNAGNYASVCGGATPLGNGVTPTTDSYIVILQ